MIPEPADAMATIMQLRAEVKELQRLRQSDLQRHYEQLDKRDAELTAVATSNAQLRERVADLCDPMNDPRVKALVEAADETLRHLIVLVCMVETNTLPQSLSGFSSHIDKARAALAALTDKGGV